MEISSLGLHKFWCLSTGTNAFFSSSCIFFKFYRQIQKLSSPQIQKLQTNSKDVLLIIFFSSLFFPTEAVYVKDPKLRKIEI